MAATIDPTLLNRKTSVNQAKSQDSEIKSGQQDTVRTFSRGRPWLGSRAAAAIRIAK
jgi:hypothetical protein